MPKTLPALLLFLLGLLPLSASAQKTSNDGFQRRNGQMHVLRNGQVRPMLRDARLPTGAVVTTDGFVVGADGKRTELREGQGCDLKGNPVAVVAAASGGLALSAPAQRPAARASSALPAVDEVRAVLEDLLNRGNQDNADRDEYDEKYEEQAREQRKKEEEWQREDRKRREEHEREREKKWKEKRKEGKKWDD